MHLKTYIQAARGNGIALAQALGIPPSYLSQMANADRAVTPERASKIEAATGGAVRRWDVRPTDWHLIWPELVGAEGAPPIQQPTEALQAQGA